MQLILDLDTDEVADKPLTVEPDYAAWRVLDAAGRSVGVGYLARLGVSSASHPLAVATTIEVLHGGGLDDDALAEVLE